MRFVGVVTKTRLLYLHLPKTAGVSLRAYFDRHFAPARVFSFADGAAGKVPAGTCFVTGHLYGGWLNRLPSDVVTATVLRHPVDRVVSQYRYWRGFAEIPTGDEIARHQVTLAKKHDLATLLELDDPVCRGSFRDLQTQMLGLDRPRGFTDPLPDARTLARALARLRAINCVGVTEALPDLALAVAWRCGWLCEPSLQRLNASPGEGVKISPALRRAILAINHHDLALYRAARRLAQSRGRALDPARVDAAARRRIAASARAQARTIRLDGGFTGTGWSERQRLAGTYCRSAIARRSTVMTGPMPAGAGRLTLTMPPGTWRGHMPVVTLNGVVIDLRHAGAAARFTALVPPGVFRADDANVIAIAPAGDPLDLPLATIALRSRS